MEVNNVNINSLIPYENNPRNNGNAVEAVKQSIIQCGYIAPIIVDENMVVLAGHTRLMALQQLGYENCEVIVKSGLSEEQKKKYRILDNKTNEFAGWDFEKLIEELEGLDFGDFDFGFEINSDQSEEKERKEVNVGSEEYQIIIDCENEYDMQVKFEQIKEIGIECRLSTL